MNRDNEFIELINQSLQIIKSNMPSNIDDINRFNLIADKLEGMKITVREGKLNAQMYYLSVTQMIERYDPELVIQKILILNEFYCKHYQQL